MSMVKYWLYTGGPVGKSVESLVNARKKAISYIKDTGRHHFGIVEASEEPYDWKMNFKVVGSVDYIDGRYCWIPKDKTKDCRVIDSKGNLKEKVARPRYW